jgi:hypothetical protein
MSTRNFDSRVIIQRLQQQNYARNLYQNNVNGQGLINNPQNSDGNSSRYNTFVSGTQTDYFRGLLGGGETVSLGGTYGIPQIITPTVSIPSTSVPGAPTINSITTGDQQLSVAFTTGSTGGSPITDYEYSTDNGTSFTSAGTIVSPIIITSLVNGTTYQVIIRAVNVNGFGANSNEVYGTTIPGAPTINYIVPRNTELYVSFTEGLDGGYTITDYLYSLNGGIFTSSGTTVSPIVITSLNNGTSYSVEIRAVNAIGFGAVSNSVSNTPYEPVYLDYDPSNTFSYPGSGTTVRSVGTAGVQDGTINSIDGGAVTYGQGTGISRNVFKFGLGGNIAFTPYDFTNYITINAWIYPYGVQNPNAINTLIANCASGYPPTAGFKAMWNLYQNPNYVMNLELAREPYAFTDCTALSGPLIPNSWQFVSFVFDNNNHIVQIYKNGLILSTYTNVISGVIVSGQSFKIGMMTDDDFGMSGELGYIKIYDGILSDAQIAAEFNTSKESFGL